VWSGDLTGGILCGLLIVSGIFLVQQSVAELSYYAKIPFPHPPDTDGAEGNSRAVAELAGVMEDVEAGGWQDAVRALTALHAVGERYGLPAPDRTPRKPAADQTDH
jgi:hypothetical protein